MASFWNNLVICGFVILALMCMAGGEYVEKRGKPRGILVQRTGQQQRRGSKGSHMYFIGKRSKDFGLELNDVMTRMRRNDNQVTS